MDLFYNNDLENKANNNHTHDYALSTHYHSEYWTDALIINRFKALHTTYWTVISEPAQTALNCQLEACSGYLVFAMQDINNDTVNPLLMFITTSATAVKTIATIYGDSTKLFTMIPTSGLIIGFYPCKDYYIHFSMIKLY